MGEANELIRALAHDGAEVLLAMTWEGTLTVLFLLALVTLLRRLPACVKCGLWLIVVLKLALPLALPFVSGVPGLVPRPGFDWEALDLAAARRPAMPLPAQRSAAPGGSSPAIQVTGGVNGSAAPALNSAQPASAFADSSAAEIQLSAFTLPTLSIYSWIGLGWLLSVGGVLLFRLVSYSRLRRLIARVGRAPHPELAAAASELANALGLRGPVRLVEVDGLASPLVLGVLRPLVVMPEPVGDGDLTPAELRALLAHALCHLRRRDHWTLPFETLALALHWFNPLAWIAVRRLRAERERATDDAVVSIPGEIESAYGSGLVKLARRRGEVERFAPAGALALFERQSDLAARIRRMMLPSRRVVPRLGAGWLLLLALFALAIVPTAGLSAAESARVSVEGSILPESFVSTSPDVQKVTGPILGTRLLPQVAIESGKSIFGSAQTEGMIRTVEVTNRSGAIFLVQTIERKSAKSHIMQIGEIRWAGTSKPGSTDPGLPATSRVAPSPTAVSTPSPRNPSRLSFNMVYPDQGRFLDAQGKLRPGVELPAGTEAVPGRLATFERGTGRRIETDRDFVVMSKPELTDADLARIDAEPDRASNESGSYAVNLQFSPEGTRKFAELTRKAGASVPRLRLAIIVNGVVRSAPTLDEPILDGRAVIRGGFTREEAEELASVLNPAPDLASILKMPRGVDGVTSLTCDSIVQNDTGITTATGHVDVRFGNVRAQAGRAVFERNAARVTLSDHPVVFQENAGQTTRMSAAQIVLETGDDGKVGVHLRRNGTGTLTEVLVSGRAAPGGNGKAIRMPGAQ